MQAQPNYSTKPLERAKQSVTRIQGRGEVRYKNVCAVCTLPNDKKLIRIRRASGDIYLCHKHARGII